WMKIGTSCAPTGGAWIGGMLSGNGVPVGWPSAEVVLAVARVGVVVTITGGAIVGGGGSLGGVTARPGCDVGVVVVVVVAGAWAVPLVPVDDGNALVGTPSTAAVAASICPVVGSAAAA